MDEHDEDDPMRVHEHHLVVTTVVGCGFLHVAIDDATRLAYVEGLPDERPGLTTGFLIRVLRWFRAQGIRHIRTWPYTPKTNGKAERFIQTPLREWAYAIPFPSSDRRTADLPQWLVWHNH